MSLKRPWETEEFVRREAARIRDVGRWPRWPFLPLKNMNDPSPSTRLGFLMDPGNGFGRVVVFCAMLPLFYEASRKESRPIRFRCPPTKEFGSVEEMIRAGWVGD